MTNEEIIKNDLMTLHLQLNNIESKLDEIINKKDVQQELIKPVEAKKMYPATCSKCGKHTEVPFNPREGAKVKCRDCWLADKEN